MAGRQSAPWVWAHRSPPRAIACPTRRPARSRPSLARRLIDDRPEAPDLRAQVGRRIAHEEPEVVSDVCIAHLAHRLIVEIFRDVVPQKATAGDDAMANIGLFQGREPFAPIDAKLR